MNNIKVVLYFIDIGISEADIVIVIKEVRLYINED